MSSACAVLSVFVYEEMTTGPACVPWMKRELAP
jgi:hypothetical protein